jgi:hypothetical protein
MEEINDKLLIPGYYGLLTLEQAKYIADNLKDSIYLRRIWGFRKRKKYSLTAIAEKSLPENPESARNHILSQIKKKQRHEQGKSVKYNRNDK